MAYFRDNYSGDLTDEIIGYLTHIADFVGNNPLGLSIALRRVAEEGWEVVLQKLSLASPICQEDISMDLYRPLWTAYEALPREYQNFFVKLSKLAELRWYDEDHLSIYWNVLIQRANDILLRFEKEAGFTHRLSEEKPYAWVFHHQVMLFAKSLMCHCSVKDRIQIYCSRIQMAWQQKRPCEITNLFHAPSFGEVIRFFRWSTQEKRRLIRIPYALDFLHSIFVPFKSSNWKILNDFSRNFSAQHYFWGAKLYLLSLIDGAFLWVLLLANLANLLVGLKVLPFQGFRFPVRNDFLLIALLAAIGVVFIREIHRRYDWGQLWLKSYQEEDEKPGSDTE